MLNKRKKLVKIRRDSASLAYVIGNFPRYTPKLALIALFATVEMHKTHLTLPQHINSLNLLCAN